MPAKSAARLPRIVVPPALTVAVAAAIWEFGRNVTPDYSGTALFGTTATDTLPLKSGLTSVVLGLAAVQLGLALWIYGRLPRISTAPPHVARIHRITGMVLILVSIPVAYHCMFAYGVQTLDTRIVVHSMAGCILYGALLGKVVVVRSTRLPTWMLPIAGGLLVGIVVILFYTAAFWYYNGFALPQL